MPQAKNPRQAAADAAKRAELARQVKYVDTSAAKKQADATAAKIVKDFGYDSNSKPKPKETLPSVKEYKSSAARNDMTYKEYVDFFKGKKSGK